jgi:hypothetical protein
LRTPDSFRPEPGEIMTEERATYDAGPVVAPEPERAVLTGYVLVDASGTPRTARLSRAGAHRVVRQHPDWKVVPCDLVMRPTREGRRA